MAFMDSSFEESMKPQVFTMIISASLSLFVISYSLLNLLNIISESILFLSQPKLINPNL